MTSLAPSLSVLPKLKGAVLAWPRHLSTKLLHPMTAKSIRDATCKNCIPYSGCVFTSNQCSRTGIAMAGGTQRCQDGAHATPFGKQQHRRSASGTVVFRHVGSPATLELLTFVRGRLNCCSARSKLHSSRNGNRCSGASSVMSATIIRPFCNTLSPQLIHRHK